MRRSPCAMAAIQRVQWEACTWRPLELTSRSSLQHRPFLVTATRTGVC